MFLSAAPVAPKVVDYGHGQSEPRAMTVEEFFNKPEPDVRGTPPVPLPPHLLARERSRSSERGECRQ